MRRVYQKLPVYTGDVSGVCSALYELGGMVVMHDPSGCNSTYNTHDETRWYRQDSLIFLSGLTERDAVMGNDAKMVKDTVAAAEKLHPAFIALAGSPIPFLNGTDFPAMARLMEKETGIPAFFVPSNGMHDYVHGAGEALAAAAGRLVNPPERIRPGSVNILGMTPLDFAGAGSVESLRRKLAGNWEIVSCFAMGDSLEDLRRAGEAQVNLVVSSAGLKAAKVLRERFGTPYVAGAPVGLHTEKVLAALEKTAQDGQIRIPFRDRRASDAKVKLIGEAVVMGSLADAYTEKTGKAACVICPLEDSAELLGPADRSVRGEEEITLALADSEMVMGDPLYRAVCGAGTAFYEIPHLAFSGRSFRKQMPDLFKNCEEEKQQWD